eukprot:g4975.t1
MASTDRDALLALYTATDGPNWKENRNWNTYADLSEWDGVSVNGEGRVVAISLDFNNLRGRIPMELGKLEALETLSVAVNQLSGRIPPELGKLEALKTLSLWDNQLSAPIPPELGNLAALRILNIAGNALSGTIPPELGKLTALQTLYLYSNQLSGPIPPDLGDLRQLQRLWLNENHLTGSIPPEVGNLASLKQLYLRQNSLSGSIPKELGALSELSELRLFDNQLTGPIPPELGHLAALQKLDLYRNQLNGVIPAELGQLAALAHVDLSRNNLTGEIPVSLGQLSNLEWLNLSANKLSGRIPKELGALTKLKGLGLQKNQLTVFARAVAERFADGETSVNTSGNPWMEPPATVMRQGMVKAASFLRDLDDYGRTWSNRLKVVLVGLGGAGKTTIAVRLEDRFGSRLPKPDERTVGVEIRDIKLGSSPTTKEGVPNVELDVSLWDFAGERAYYDTHQMFLTQGALFVLAVDLHAYSTRNSADEALDQWLDILQSRVPGAIVLLVGTHADLFGANLAESRARTDSFKRDVDKIMDRISFQCASAQNHRENDLGKGQLDSNPRFQPLCVVIDDEILTLNLASSNGQDVDLLQKRIEYLAYNGCEGRSFASVMSLVPEPYLPAIATLEAVRRGADLVGSGGTLDEVARRFREADAEKARTFIRFSEALSLFVEQQQQNLFSRVSKFFCRREEEERVFREAIELHEAHGAILLARVDGGGEAQQEVGTRNIIIHVNPSRFADLVRRIVGVKVNPMQQAEVAREMKASFSARPNILPLLKQHKRFTRAGEVSMDYLKFLWQRNMEVGEVGQQAPPLHLSDEDMRVMVGSLLDVRFMFRVRDGCDDFKPDLYVVASCLPKKAGKDVKLAPLLEPKAGCAIVSQKLKLLGAHAVPPGLVPRLLAWCGSGEGRIETCWKRGVCFSFKNHLVLLYEVRAADDGTSWIECHVRGGVQDDSARKVLDNIGDEISKLINDARYGFPGLGLDPCEEEETAFSSDGELEVLAARFSMVLRDQMNMQFRMDRSMREDMAFIRWPIPRLVCVLPAPANNKLLEERERSFEEWSIRLRNWCHGGKQEGKGKATRKLRVFFLCAQDMSLVECGPKGQGYEAKELLGWAKKAMPVAKVGLALATIAFNAISGLALPPANLKAALGTEAGGVLSKILEDSLSSGFEAMASTAGENLDNDRQADLLRQTGAHGCWAQNERPTPLQGFAYDQLKEVIRKFEGMRGSSSFCRFDTTMKLVDRGGQGEEWAWVRNRNSDTFAS